MGEEEKKHSFDNQRQFLADFNKRCKIQMNPILFKRSDDEIIEELKKVILSCERSNKYFTIKVLGFTEVDDYAEINQILYNYYEDMTKNKSKLKKRDNPYGFINLNESDIKLLMVDYYVEVYTKPPVTTFPNAKPLPTEEQFRVLIAVPRIIDRYYMRINGIMRSTLYQIVDGSTYNNSNTSSKIPNISFKIVFMALRVFRYYLDLSTISGETIRLSHYMCNCFNKTVTACKYILAKFGFLGAIDFMGIKGVTITPYPITDPTMYCFEKAKDLYVSAPRYLVDNDLVTQSFICSVYNSIIPGMDYSICYEEKFWLRSIGADFNGTSPEKVLSMLNKEDATITDTYDKGCSILDSFETIYDISTRESIRLPEDQKATMYHILRWILREFNKLKAKNNLDVGIKKIRFAEYIASIYAIKVAKGIYRVADMNNKITTSAIRRAIRTDPMFLLTSVSKSNLVAYRNGVSDMDAMAALKFTYKGIAGLGERAGDRSIPDSTRFIHQSHLGRLDLDSSSDGNPGITGTISPFTTMYDNYFSDYQEPNSWEDRFKEIYEDYKKACGFKEAVEFKKEVLGKIDEEQEVTANEIVAAMQQIVLPYINANEGELYSPVQFYKEDSYELQILPLLQSTDGI